MFIVWGPLMVGGTFFVATGQLPAWVWLASLPYAILVTTVLFGKHIDKIQADAAKGIHTLPVILGEARARLVAQGLMIAFYPIVIGAALVGFIGPWVALVLLGIPRLVQVLRVFAEPRPEVAAALVRRLAAVVRGRGLRPHPARRRAADPGPAPERDPAHPAALGLTAGGALAAEGAGRYRSCRALR